MVSKRFPIQGGLTVSWEAAENAYRGYTRLYRDAQSLERIAERGGFGLGEFVGLVLAARASSRAAGLNIVRTRLTDDQYTKVLAKADIRSEP
jgi:hypothetical protein